MTYNPKQWDVVWRSLVITFLDNGFVWLVEKAAKERKWHLRLVTDVAAALDVETLDRDGELYWKLSDKVVPILPRRNEEPQQTATIGGAA
jgi:hypothetical protein